MKIDVMKFERKLMESGLNRGELARKAMLNNATITKVGRGEDIRPTSVCRIAIALDCKANDLI